MTAAFLKSIKAVTGGTEGVSLGIYASPGAKSTHVSGRHGDLIKVRIAAPPADGAANAELIAFLAGLLGVPKKAVVLRSGASSRLKCIVVHGVQFEQVHQLILASLPKE